MFITFIKKVIVAVYAAVVGEVDTYHKFKKEEERLKKSIRMAELSLMTRKEVYELYLKDKITSEEHYASSSLVDDVSYHERQLVNYVIGGKCEWETSYHKKKALEARKKVTDAMGALSEAHEALDSLPATYRDLA